MYLVTTSNTIKVIFMNIFYDANKIYEAVKKELEHQHRKMDIHMCETFEQSMQLAKRVAKPGQIVLFSPASTSFDMFKDMYDRGDQFKNMVMKF